MTSPETTSPSTPEPWVVSNDDGYRRTFETEYSAEQFMRDHMNAGLQISYEGSSPSTPAGEPEQSPAQKLAELVLHMDMVTPKGVAARQLARDVLADDDRLRHALRLIAHATNPELDDGGEHEAAYELATAALATPVPAQAVPQPGEGKDRFNRLRQMVDNLTVALTSEGIYTDFPPRRLLLAELNDLCVALDSPPPPAPAQAVPTDESGWLIEHSGAMPGVASGSISWLKANVPSMSDLKSDRDLLGFTHDASKALRFARKEDAEAVLKWHLGFRSPDWYSKPYSVAEHMWPAAPGRGASE